MERAKDWAANVVVVLLGAVFWIGLLTLVALFGTVAFR